MSKSMNICCFTKSMFLKKYMSGNDELDMDYLCGKCMLNYSSAVVDLKIYQAFAH